MSTHTMPPLSLLAADFVKSLLKTAGTQENDEAAYERTQTEKTGKHLYSRRRMLNGGTTSFMNGHAGHSDDDESAEEEVHTEVKVKVNEMKRTTINDEDVEMVEEATALEKRKSLIVKSEEINANTAKSSLAQQRRDNEKQLKHIATYGVELEF